MKRQQSLLIIEDDESLMLGLEENLNVAGYRVLTASNGAAGLKLAIDRKPDLILLDLNLPDLGGYEICKRLREQRHPASIIMLTARKEEADKLRGFELGADDYVTKPFSVKELLARVNAILMRSERKVEKGAQFRFGEYVLDMDTRTMSCKGKPVELTRTEFDLLAYMLANEGKSLSRETLLRDVWGTEYYGTQRSLDTFVAMLRSKIEKKSNAPRHILTVHGVGYKFCSGG
jgi:two-component system alkaline phosphatase synthesis response regulator PhoP